MDDAEVDSAGTREPHIPRTPRKAAISSWIGSAWNTTTSSSTARPLRWSSRRSSSRRATRQRRRSPRSRHLAWRTWPGRSVRSSSVIWATRSAVRRFLSSRYSGWVLATFLIGLMPTYNQIGFAAPILLLILRLCQGLAVSGEQSSASSTTLEHAPPNRRALLHQLHPGRNARRQHPRQRRVPPDRCACPRTPLLSWGWRIPFLLSAIVMLVGWLDPAHPGREPGVRGGAGAPRCSQSAAARRCSAPTPRTCSRFFSRHSPR